jgi:hypothetical protein
VPSPVPVSVLVVENGSKIRPIVTRSMARRNRKRLRAFHRYCDLPSSAAHLDPPTHRSGAVLWLRRRAILPAPFDATWPASATVCALEWLVAAFAGSYAFVMDMEFLMW